MRVAVYYKNTDIRIEERPVPKIGHGEILVRIEASGICGSDCMEWYRINRVPLILGHEVAGVVVEVGSGVGRFKKNDRVVVAHHVPCGDCRYCRDGHETVCDTLRATNFDPGGFAEYVRVPAINVEKGVFMVPDDVSFEAATFVEPLACVVRGQRLARAAGLAGKTVLVIGSGMSGLLHVQLAKVRGASRVIATDVAPYRIAAAKRFGADYAVSAKECSPGWLKTVNEGRLADLVVICASADAAFAQGFASVERGGTVLIFAAAGKDAAVALPVNALFWRNEVTVTSSYAGSPADHRDALELIRSKKIDVCDMISHRFGLNETGEGFRLVAEARDSIKVIIETQR